jgi:hypothetical protein
MTIASVVDDALLTPPAALAVEDEVLLAATALVVSV